MKQRRRCRRVQNCSVEPGDTHRDIDTAAVETTFWRSGSGVDLGNAVVGEARFATEHEGVPGDEVDIGVGLAPVDDVAEPEAAGVADAQRDDGLVDGSSLSWCMPSRAASS